MLDHPRYITDRYTYMCMNTCVCLCKTSKDHGQERVVTMIGSSAFCFSSCVTQCESREGSLSLPFFPHRHRFSFYIFIIHLYIQVFIIYVVTNAITHIVLCPWRDRSNIYEIRFDHCLKIILQFNL